MADAVKEQASKELSLERAREMGPASDGGAGGGGQGSISEERGKADVTGRRAPVLSATQEARFRWWGVGSKVKVSCRAPSKGHGKLQSHSTGVFESGVVLKVKNKGAGINQGLLTFL